MRVVPLSAAVFLFLQSTSCLASVTEKSSYLRKSIEASKAVETKEQNALEDSSYWARLMQDTANMSAEPGPINGPSDKGDVGDLCFDNADCSTNVCVEDPPVGDGSGRCACNADTQEGCDGDFFCATPDEIFLAVGELVSVATFCKLPVGAPCQDSFECLTAICDPLTNTCGCNPNTNFPCGDGEACLIDPVEGHVCKDPEGEVGDGSLGSDCLVDADCLTGVCYYGFQPPGTLGTCTCNALTNAGCSGNFKCFSSEDFQEISGIFDVAPECLLSFGAPCDSQADIGSSCVTGNCAKVTNQCTCNEVTNYPCDTENGETCIIDAEGSFACLGAEVECPVPSEGTPCTVEENPVVCPGECEYANQCVATSADPTFTNETCSLVNSVCPVPSGGTPCTTEENPVVCPGGCEYPNQCVATSADPSFTNETCSLINGPSNKGDVGDLCFENVDCRTNVCVEDPPVGDGSGRCACNADTQEGCDGDFFCATPDEIFLAVGELVSVATFCKLPVGAPCQDSFECLTAICDPLTNTCGCNPNTNFPCGDGEACLIDPVEGHVCKDPEGEVGDGSLGSDCLVDADCLTGECFYGEQLPGTPGTCTCNALTNAGCGGNFECFSSVDLEKMMGIADAPPECLLPFGAPCDSQADIGSSCVTGNCAKVTNQCTCNEWTNYPCDVENGETCVIDAEGSFACLGAEVECPMPSEETPCTLEENPVVCPGECEYLNQCVATSADPTFTDETCSLVNSVCPVPSEGTPCTLEYNPVVCPGECEYANQCVATSADPSFTNETCSLVNSGCPVPSVGTPCTTDENPVVCPGECEYPNQCVATSADPSFTNETCSLVNKCPVDGTGTSICTLEYLPVNCFGCEYANQCLATSADASFTNETCTLVESVCPVSTGICTEEYAPVNCSGCEYSNQCVATDANPEFTPETCTPVPINP